jgi:hypothetical protein
MHVRTTLVALLAAAAMTAVSAPPAHAATATAVTFGGRIAVTPTLTGVPVTEAFCFSITSCGNTAVPEGAAAGATLRTEGTAPVAVDGLRGSITYAEACGLAGFAPTGSGSITVSAHDAVAGTWTQDVTATYDRTGTIMRFNGAVSGVVSFVPAGVPACGASTEVVLSGVLSVLG